MVRQSALFRRGWVCLGRPRAAAPNFAIFPKCDRGNGRDTSGQDAERSHQRRVQTFSLDRKAVVLAVGPAASATGAGAIATPPVQIRLDQNRRLAPLSQRDASQSSRPRPAGEKHLQKPSRGAEELMDMTAHRTAKAAVAAASIPRNPAAADRREGFASGEPERAGKPDDLQSRETVPPAAAKNSASVKAKASLANGRSSIRAFPTSRRFSAICGPGVEATVLDAVWPAARHTVLALDGRSDLDAVHIIAHGAPGRVSFAAREWSTRTLNDAAEDFAAIGRALCAGGELRLRWSFCPCRVMPRVRHLVRAWAQGNRRRCCQPRLGLPGRCHPWGGWELYGGFGSRLLAATAH